MHLQVLHRFATSYMDNSISLDPYHLPVITLTSLAQWKSEQGSSDIACALGRKGVSQLRKET